MKNFLDEFALQNNKTSKEVYKSDYDAFENKGSTLPLVVHLHSLL